MGHKDYTIAKIEGEYAYLRETALCEGGAADPEKDIYIALALLPPGVDVGDKLHYEMFSYTVAEG